MTDLPTLRRREAAYDGPMGEDISTLIRHDYARDCEHYRQRARELGVELRLARALHRQSINIHKRARHKAAWKRYRADLHVIMELWRESRERRDG